MHKFGSYTVVLNRKHSTSSNYSNAIYYICSDIIVERSVPKKSPLLKVLTCSGVKGHIFFITNSWKDWNRLTWSTQWCFRWKPHKNPEEENPTSLVFKVFKCLNLPTKSLETRLGWLQLFFVGGEVILQDFAFRDPIIKVNWSIFHHKRIYRIPWVKFSTAANIWDYSTFLYTVQPIISHVLQFYVTSYKLEKCTWNPKIEVMFR